MISISKKYVLNDVKQVNNMKAISKNTCIYNNISYIAIEYKEINTCMCSKM